MWHSRFQKLLKANFDEARKRNPSYSLRSFARRLKISPGALSEVMHGRRRLSLRKSLTLIELLPKPDAELKRRMERILHSKAKERVLLPAECHEIVAHWQNFALLSLLSCDNCPPDTAGLASRLGIEEKTVRDSLRHLIACGLVEENDDGGFEATGINWRSSDGFPSEAVVRSHLEGLQLAEKALRTQSHEKRDFVSLTIGGDRKSLEKARKDVRRFVERLNKTFTGKETNSVFRLNVQLFPLDQGEGSCAESRD